MVTFSNNVKRGCGVDMMQVLNEVLTLPGSLHPLSTLQNLGGAIKPAAPQVVEMKIFKAQ